MSMTDLSLTACFIAALAWDGWRRWLVVSVARHEQARADAETQRASGLDERIKTIAGRVEKLESENRHAAMQSLGGRR